MNRTTTFVGLMIAWVMLSANFAVAQDWPQWRGANRDARATGFTPPQTWPKELTKKWSVDVGDGVATPSLVGNKLYVFTHQDGNEIIRCLDAATGQELWQDKYKMSGASGAAGGFAGPRASPTVADGKVITLGVRGTLSCLDAEKGKVLWFNEDYADSWPRFFTSSSPIVAQRLCIAQLGDERDGGVAAFDLNTGKEKWKWEVDGPSYASPVLLDFEGQKVIVAVTDRYLVALNAADGNELWKTSYSQGRYNSATPIVAGEAIIIAGPSSGITAVKLVKKDDKFATEELWKNRDNSVQFSTPLVRDGWLYGLSGLNSLFCLSTTSDSDKTAWNAPLGQPAAEGRPRENARREDQPREDQPREGGPPRDDRPRGDQPRDDGPRADRPRDEAQDRRPGERREGDRGPGERGPEFGQRGPGFGGGRRGGGGGRGYGSVVDAGPVLLALNPTGSLVVFEPNEKEFKQLATYKVAEGNTYAYPVVVGNRVYIKDKDAVTLWTID